MMAVFNRAIGIAVLAALVCSAWGQEGDQCLPNLMITLTGGWKCWSKVANHCEAFMQSNSQYKEAFAEWFGGDFEGNVCSSVKHEIAANAVAKAISQVYIFAYTNVECTEEVPANECGWSHFNKEAWALAISNAVALASADVGGDEAKGVCTSDIRAVSTVVSDVAAGALSDGCVNGRDGKMFRWSESHQRALVIGVAKAFEQATAKVCQGGVYDLSGAAECEEDGSSSDTDGSFTEGDGGGYAEGAPIPNCLDRLEKECCSRAYRRKPCICPSEEDWCEEGEHFKTNNFIKDGFLTLVAPSGAKCTCEV